MGAHQVYHVPPVGLSQGSRHEGFPLFLLLTWQLCSAGGNEDVRCPPTLPPSPHHLASPCLTLQQLS